MSITSNLGRLTEHRVFRTVLLILLLAMIALVAYVAQPNNKPTSTHTAATTSPALKKETPAHPTNTTNAKSTTSSKSTATSTSSSAEGNPSANDAATSGLCSTILTAAQAKSVLGGNPGASASNGVTSQNTDITTTTCTYTVGSNSATIIQHKSNSPTGQHENDDQFGSSRPSGVTSMSGYGQVAYWQPSTGLNVLQNNNWYVINVSGNESSSEQLAKAAQL